MASILQNIKFYFKTTLFGSLIIGCALYGLFASLFLRAIGKKEYAQYTVARAFYYSFSTVMGVKITLKNEDYLFKKPGIFISNHQSALDIFVLGRIFEVGFTVTAKKALRYVPFLGWFMVASGAFFLDRAKGEKARKVLNKGLEDIKNEKRGLFIFPEGTRSGVNELEMLPFKKGAFHLAKTGNLPLTPIVVSNTSTIFDSRRKIFNRGEIFIEVLKPISTEGLETNEQLTEFCAEVRGKMLAKLRDIGYSRAANEGSPQLAQEEESKSSSESDESDPEPQVLSEDSPSN